MESKVGWLAKLNAASLNKQTKLCQDLLRKSREYTNKTIPTKKGNITINTHDFSKSWECYKQFNVNKF